MHPWRLWILLAALAATTSLAAVIYKWKDSNGVIHYSDQPVPGAEKIYTPASPSGQPAAAPARIAPPGSQPQSAQKDGPLLGYTEFSIASPAADQTFFGDEPVIASVTLNPALNPNHVLAWHLNGTQLEDQGGVTQFALQHLDRGTYVIAATITDPGTGESRSTGSVTFYVRQPSALSPLHKKP